MWETFTTVFSTMMGLLICLAIGFMLRRFHMEPENTSTVLSKLEFYVLMPAVTLSAFIKNCDMQSIAENSSLILYGAVTTVATFAIGRIFGRFYSKDRNERKIYSYSMTCANYGYIGTPLVQSIMGSHGLYVYSLYQLPLNMLVNGYLIPSLIPEGKASTNGKWWRSMVNPPTIALAVGLVLGLTGWGKLLPGFVINTADTLGNCMGPIAMILSGFVIGNFDVSELLKNKKVYLVSFLRLTILPAALVGLVWALGGDKNTCLLTMITFASALGLNTVVVPAAYGGDTRLGASMAVISSVGSLVTIPLLYSILNTIL